MLRFQDARDTQDALDRLPLVRHAARDRVPLRRRGPYRAPGACGDRRCGLGGLPLHADQPQGRPCRALDAPRRLPALVQRAAPYREPRGARGLSHGRAAGPTRPAKRRRAADALSPQGGRAHRPDAPPRLHLQRAPLRRFFGRHAGVCADRERHAPDQPELQVPPAARHPQRRRGGALGTGPARRRRAHRAQPAGDPGRALRRPQRRRRQCLAERSLRPRRLDRAARAALPRRLLLQDLPLAGVVLEVSVRARDPAHGGARPRPRRARSRQLRQDVRPLRRAGGGRRAGGHRRSACRRRERRARGAGGRAGDARRRAAGPPPPHRRRGRHGLGRAHGRAARRHAGGARAHPHHALRLLRPQHAERAGAAQRPSGAACSRRHEPPAPLDPQGAPRGARRRRPRAAAGLRRQRPPRDPAGLGGAALPQRLCGAARQARGALHQQRRGLRGGARHRRRGRRPSPPWSTAGRRRRQRSRRR